MRYGALLLLLLTVAKPAFALDLLLAEPRRNVVPRDGGRLHIMHDYRDTGYVYPDYAPVSVTTEDISSGEFANIPMTSADFGPAFDPSDPSREGDLYYFTNADGKCIYAIDRMLGRTPLKQTRAVWCHSTYVHTVRYHSGYLYFSTSNEPRAEADGAIWRFNLATWELSHFMTVPLGQIGNFWGGDFGFNPYTGELWISTGKGQFYRHTCTRWVRVHDNPALPDKKITGFDFMDEERILYTNGSREIGRFDIPPSENSVLVAVFWTLSEFEEDSYTGFEDLRVVRSDGSRDAGPSECQGGSGAGTTPGATNVTCDKLVPIGIAGVPHYIVNKFCLPWPLPDPGSVFENLITIQPLHRICWAVRGLSCLGCQAGLCPTFDILFGNVRGFDIFLVDRASRKIVSKGKARKGDQMIISVKPEFVDEKAHKILPILDLVVVPEVLKKKPSPNIKPPTRAIKMELLVNKNK